jgi:hypothetical protein
MVELGPEGCGFCAAVAFFAEASAAMQSVEIDKAAIKDKIKTLKLAAKAFFNCGLLYLLFEF